MTNKSEALSNDLLIADTLLRLKAIENLFIAKGIFSREEFNAEMTAITRVVVKALLEKANVTGNLDELIDSLGKGSDN